VQRRSPISQDPHIRGYKYSQIYTQADGVYWTPARLDLDTMLSKIDPNMIQDVTVVPGPYGLRYGPGFAFIDVTRMPTPRSTSGIVQDFETNFDTRTNGGQVNFRESVSGGGADWGYRFSYGARKGSDYRAGNDLKIPSSYESQDVWGELSYDINSHQRLDFAFQRLDQTDTEFPAQFFDLNFLGTYGFQAALTDDSPYGPWNRMTVETWYNRTWFDGDSRNKANRPDFPVMQRVDEALDAHYGTLGNHLSAYTQGAGYSSGARSMATFGSPDDQHVNVGADFRYLGQDINEQYNIARSGVTVDDFTTNMPHAWMLNPGVFAEWSSPVNDVWTMSVGSRADIARTTARASDLRPTGNLLPYADELTQNDTLYSFYLTNDVEMNDFWTLTGGFGYGQRPPSLVERYADGLFLSLAQSGFERFIGDPTLDYERNWQVDVGVTGEFDRVRVRANAFHAWIIDYITWQDDYVPSIPDARLLRFINTPLATLTGFELSGEYDLSPTLTSFGEMAYIDGRDRTIDQPLPAMSPLDNRLGLRWHDPEKGRRWGLELAARLVLYQDRLGTIRQGDTGFVQVETFTPGFTVWDLRSYWNYTDTLRFVAGIDNLFDETYQEHLDLRLGPSTGVPGWTRVYEPGITPYFGVNWIF
jgi:outer membrane receptor protein involved in Fe transport